MINFSRCRTTHDSIKKQFHFNDISIDVSIVYSINTVCKLSVRFPRYEKNCAFIKNSLGAKVYIFGTQISFICRRFQIRSADGLLMSFSNNCSIFAQETNKQQQTLYSLLYSLYTFMYLVRDTYLQHKHNSYGCYFG